MRRRLRLTGLLLSVVFITVMISSCVFMGTAAGHHCDRMCCRVCMQVALLASLIHSVAILKGISSFFAAPGMLVSHGFLFVYSLLSGRTLVGRKVRLNN